MNSIKKLNIIFSLFLVLVLMSALCSCKSKNNDETGTTTEAATDNAEITAVTEAVASTQAPQTQTQVSETTILPAATETQPQQEAVTEEVEISGAETITDGNKTIVYPLSLKSSQRTYPVIAWANGTGCPTQTYISLLEALSNGGYIVIADSSVMTANGSSQIDSVNYIVNKNSDSSSIFYNKADLNAVGVCGHSQGGRSCVNAAKADSRIKCVVSIAGASSTEEASGLNTPSLFLTGTNDMVVISSRWCKPSYDAVTGRAAYASLKGGIHTTCITNPEKVSGYALNWFDAYLKNDSDAAAVFYDGGKLANDGNWQDFQNKN